MTVALYRKVYTITIKETINPDRWYYSREGKTFDSELIRVSGRPYYAIDYIHKIPTEYANVIGFRKDAKYLR
jgi:hypothetical protein